MNSHVIISIAHIAIVVPLFLYVAFSRAATPDWLYWVLFTIGLIIFMVHSVKGVNRWMSGSTYVWVNLLHVLLIAPLLVYIGYYGKKTPRPAYELLAMAGFAAAGYHMYNILMQAMVFQD